MQIHEDFGWGGSDDRPRHEENAEVWAGSEMACLYFDKKENSKNAYTNYPCRVIFRPGEVEISYIEDYQVWSHNSKHAPQSVYKGKDDGDGHYYLWNGKNGPSKGNARMHLGRSNVLEGSWEENGLRGMWMITLRR